MITNLGNVKRNVKNIYERRRAAIYAICLKWAAVMLAYFQQQQKLTPGQGGIYWFNRTAYAAATLQFIAFTEENVIGVRGFHTAFYGVYLELANNRKHEALRPIIQRYAGRVLRDVKALYAD